MKPCCENCPDVELTTEHEREEGFCRDCLDAMGDGAPPLATAPRPKES